MELACGEARWLVLDDAQVPALGSEADSFDPWRGALASEGSCRVDIVALSCEAWNKLIDQPWNIMSIVQRKWAHGF